VCIAEATTRSARWVAAATGAPDERDRDVGRTDAVVAASAKFAEQPAAGVGAYVVQVEISGSVRT
jgi:hypothetical protein